jgi:transposase
LAVALALPRTPAPTPASPAVAPPDRVCSARRGPGDPIAARSPGHRAAPDTQCRASSYGAAGRPWTGTGLTNSPTRSLGRVATAGSYGLRRWHPRHSWRICSGLTAGRVPAEQAAGELYAQDAALQRKRYVVERTLSWLKSFRRLRYRVDRTAKSFHAFVYLAVLILCVRRLISRFRADIPGQWRGVGPAALRTLSRHRAEPSSLVARATSLGWRLP